MNRQGALPDRFRCCLLGLAVGDAVGTIVEFKARRSFEPVTDMVVGGAGKDDRVDDYVRRVGRTIGKVRLRQGYRGPVAGSSLHFEERGS